jgi:AraC-like DNA-binding protein
MLYFMKNMETLLNILLFIGGAQGLLLSTALFSLRRGNVKANRILGVLLLFFSILILSHGAGHLYAQQDHSNKHQWLVHASFFIVAPILYFYSRALTQYDFRFRLKDALHFVPLFGAFISVLMLEDNSRHGESHLLVGNVLLALISLQMLAYVLRMLIILQTYTKTIQETYSSLEKINLHWLRFFVISQTVIWPIAFVIDIHKLGTGEMDFMWLLVSIFMYLIGYFGILQPEIFSGEFQQEQLSVQSGKKKYEKSALSPEQAEAILQRLQAFMQSSKPYVVPSLTLPALSKQLNISPHHLSQIINENLHKNFFEYINRFRVEEAKRLLKDPKNKHLTLSSIGLEAGFNSISSFNSIFKKVTSLTPSQYRISDNPATDKL